MWPSSETIHLSPTVFTILRDLIHDRTGIYYDEAKRELLAEKLSIQVSERGFTTFLDLYYLLKYGPDAERAWLQIMDALSVPETYFWRESPQITGFVDEILPAYVAANPTKPIRIWCAACATGEEPLTIAMALAERGWFSRCSIEITATDASPAAIQRAQEATYRERAFRTLPKHLREKYFTSVAAGWRISHDLSSRVRYSVANLTSADEIEPHVSVPFIFCRNVFIYFSDRAISRTVNHFAKKMQRPGYLFVGASESLLKHTSLFELQSVGRSFAYFLPR